MRAGGSNKT